MAGLTYQGALSKIKLGPLPYQNSKCIYPQILSQI